MENKPKQRISKGINVLVCGSQKFDDRGFVFMALEGVFNEHNGEISQITTSKFSGSCQFAREWVELKNGTLPADKQIKVVDFSLDNALGEKSNSFYESDIADFAIASSPFFQKVKDALISSRVAMVVSFPNKDGVLGVTTNNIIRCAKLATIPHVNGETLLDNYNKFIEFVKQKRAMEQVQVVEEKPLEFNNRHSSKRPT